MPKEYLKLPTFAQWKTDSFAHLGVRKNDPVLTRIDNLVDAINRTKSDSPYLYVELFYAITYWLRDHRRNPFEQKQFVSDQRVPALTALYSLSKKLLASVFACTPDGLESVLQQYSGKTRSALGQFKDANSTVDHFLSFSAARQFLVSFKNGLAYQLEWNKPNPKIVLANSSVWHAQTVDADKVLQGDFAHFVMDMDRDLYMGPHMSVNAERAGKVPEVHSSWLRGKPVQCAGSLCIENGVVTGLQNNSGHYQPTDENMLNVLEFFKTVGVNIHKIQVWDYEGGIGADGDEFLKYEGNWERIPDAYAPMIQPLRIRTKPDKPAKPDLPLEKPMVKFQCENCGTKFKTYRLHCDFCKCKCHVVLG